MRPILDRRCGIGEAAETFDSYRQFRDVLGDDFTSLYDIEERRLTAVVCRQRVGYAPAPDAPSAERTPAAAATPEL